MTENKNFLQNASKNFLSTFVRTRKANESGEGRDLKGKIIKLDKHRAKRGRDEAIELDDKWLLSRLHKES